MDARRWNCIKDLFEAALAHPTEERAAFLAAECGSDESLRVEVESLLAQTGSTQGFLETPLFERRSEVGDGTMERERIGPYRLLRRLGQGGMGAVYLAARDDEEFEQQVAIKLIKRGMDTDEVIHRFRYERQILADLQHPQIARLYDGGTTDDGLPYFVMEHVDGEPIDQYCAGRQLELRARLELFRAVCEAVDFAHRNLVVHRDLKPANILVTPAGVPKLLDFGIARLLAPGGIEPTQTVIGGRFLTPSYASPEQVRGEGVTLASDVYSLGIVLYELLTSERPFADRDSEIALLGPAALEREPRRPSSVARRRARSGDGSATVPMAASEPGRKLGRKLAGDLDAIVLKAMRTSPRDRYRSAAELGEDVGRHLAGQPVEARRGSGLYRAGKFLRRNRGGAIVAALVVGILLSVLLGWQQASDAEKARLQGQAEADRAEALEDFLVDVFGKSDPRATGGQDLSASQILREASSTIEDSLREQPETQASLLSAMGRIYRYRGEFDQAISALEKSHRLRSDTWGRDHALTLRSLNNLATALKDRGDLARAETFFRDAIARFRKYHPEKVEEIAGCLNNLATIKVDRGDLRGAATLYREALDLKLRSAEGRDRKDLANGFNNLGIVLAEIGEHDEAEVNQRKALEMYEQLGLPDADTSRNALGTLMCKSGRFDEGEKLLQVSLAWRQKALAAQPEKIVKVMRNLALCCELRGDLVGAEENLRRALALLEAEAPGSDEIANTQGRLEELLLEKTATGVSPPTARSGREPS